MPEIEYHPVLTRILYSVPDRSTVHQKVAFRAAIVSGQIEYAERCATIKLIPRFLMTYKGPTYAANYDDESQVAAARAEAVEYLNKKCEKSKRFEGKAIGNMVETEIDLRSLYAFVV